MARQFLNPAPVLHDILGIDPAFNGSLTFYDVGTTDLRDTWSDHDLTVLNENPVPLDSSARTDTQVWLDGEYTAVLRNAAGEVVWTRDLRPEQAGGDSLPAKEAGKFLTTDGTNWLLEDVLQVPDPTGFNGRILSTDGANLLWIPQPELPEPPEPDIVVSADSFLAGVDSDATKLYILRGTGTAPATGQLTSSIAISFAPGFDALWAVMVTPITSGCTSNSPPALPSWSVTGFTAGSASSGATVTFYAPPVQTISSEDTIVSTIPFAWVAIGTREVA